ncbi:hypothetical protein O0I10_007744 [Lichtheimia ornata]|uniref:Uncharacterized protein n=1 Tax=Lichtheimia ornata TaxID=688661 RepID=A0AAD7V0M2_9FUNG|nr:uncharacterized protein O0I10_007744 [Lichtheimia ornata]KAJ8656665.1 hypothetical protein O0I10_007744 [Lichtheimia ornata]
MSSGPFFIRAFYKPNVPNETISAHVQQLQNEGALISENYFIEEHIPENERGYVCQINSIHELRPFYTSFASFLAKVIPQGPVPQEALGVIQSNITHAIAQHQ